MLGFYNESYMPLGILSYVFEKVDEPKEYVRFLDLENAIFTSKFKIMKQNISLRCLYQIRQKHL